MWRFVAGGAVAALVIGTAVWVQAAGTGETITYRGRLEQNGVPVTANVNLTFHFLDASDVAIGTPITVNGVAVAGGQFSVPLTLPTAVISANTLFAGIDV